MQCSAQYSGEGGPPVVPRPGRESGGWGGLASSEEKYQMTGE